MKTPHCGPGLLPGIAENFIQRSPTQLLLTCYRKTPLGAFPSPYQQCCTLRMIWPVEVDCGESVEDNFSFCFFLVSWLTYYLFSFCIVSLSPRQYQIYGLYGLLYQLPVLGKCSNFSNPFFSSNIHCPIIYLLPIQLKQICVYYLWL